MTGTLFIPNINKQNVLKIIDSYLFEAVRMITSKTMIQKTDFSHKVCPVTQKRWVLSYRPSVIK